MEFVKYPRTKHIVGSKFKFSSILKCDLERMKGIKLPFDNEEYLVIEEKMDGTQFLPKKAVCSFNQEETILIVAPMSSRI